MHPIFTPAHVTVDWDGLICGVTLGCLTWLSLDNEGGEGESLEKLLLRTVCTRSNYKLYIDDKVSAQEMECSQNLPYKLERVPTDNIIVHNTSTLVNSSLEIWGKV